MLKNLFIFSVLSLTFSAHAQTFQKACDSGDSIIIGAVGDVLLHQPLQVQGYSQGFETLWEPLLRHMAQPDLMYANLEGPTAEGITKGGKIVKDPGPVFQNNVHTGYPLFNYHRSIIDGLLNSGVDIVSTANNHALDRGAAGAISTIEALEDAGMPYAGTRKDSSGEFYTLTRKSGWTVAWIACTYSTNGITDKKDLVLDCFDTGRVSQLIKNLKSQVDAVIVTPHWGVEYQNAPNSQQKKFARQWLDEGATAIIGAHPHVPQPWEKYKAADGREGIILYSLGNFVSNQSGTAKQSSLILYVGLTRNQGKTWVNGVRYLPLFMKRKPYAATPSNSANASSEMKASYNHVKNMFGTERILTPGEAITTNPECF